MKNEENSVASGTNQGVPWENFVKFARQLSHDLRNQLNAAELQSALITELTSDEELKSETRRLRELISQLGVTLQSLSTLVAEPRPTLLPYTVQDFINDLQNKIGDEFPEKKSTVKWDISSPGTKLSIDPQLTEWAAVELFRNAFRHGMAGDKLQVKASVAERRFTFCICEPKTGETDPTEWMQPLQKVSHGHYGLGLRRARNIIAAHGGELTASFEPASRMLISTISLPLSAEAS